MGIDADWKPDHFTLDERRTFPHISLALMVCVIKASYENDIYYSYAAMEPALLRFVITIGHQFDKNWPTGGLSRRTLADYVKSNGSAR